MSINDTLTAIYNERGCRKAITTNRYVEVVHYFGSIVEEKYPGLCNDRVEIAGKKVSHVIVSLINDALQRLIKPSIVVQTRQIASYFQHTILRSVIAEYFRQQKQDGLAGKLNEYLNADNTHVCLHEKDPRTFFRNWWGAYEWRDIGRIDIRKFEEISLDKGYHPEPYWEVLKSEGSELSEKEIVHRYTLHLLKLVEKYLQFTSLLEVFKVQFLNLQITLESELGAGNTEGNSTDDGDTDWWQTVRSASAFDHVVVREDLDEILTDVRTRFIVYMRTAGVSFPEMHDLSEIYAKTESGKKKGFTGFGKSTAQNVYESILPEIMELGYVDKEAEDVIVDLLGSEFEEIQQAINQLHTKDKRRIRRKKMPDSSSDLDSP